mmetsp:Transcript_30199/g.49206  ORF Transcript_30199/g.49206 Transcript_30199/m.49206 type:complete len:97 (-) Transcript_30199:112-402(-)
MNRLTYFMLLFAAILSVWMLPLYVSMTLSIFEQHPMVHFIWKLLPIELVFLWGIYATLSVLNAVRNVKDYPKAKHELLHEIKRAKECLTDAGFDWN